MRVTSGLLRWGFGQLSRGLEAEGLWWAMSELRALEVPRPIPAGCLKVGVSTGLVKGLQAKHQLGLVRFVEASLEEFPRPPTTYAVPWSRRRLLRSRLEPFAGECSGATSLTHRFRDRLERLDTERHSPKARKFTTIALRP